MGKIIYTTGDLIKNADEGYFDIIIHCCNCFNNMGAGIAKFIKQRWPGAAVADNATKPGDNSKLGTFTFAKVRTKYNTEFYVVNAYGQYHYAAPPVGKEINLDEDALRNSLKLINEHFKSMKDARIGFPKIGAGRAKGNWDNIEKIIEEEMTNFEHLEVIIYDKEPTRAR